MKTLLPISILFLIVSCDSGDYSLDFTSMEFPKGSTLEKSAVDSIVLAEEELYTFYRTVDYYRCETDKETYRCGEKITLTLENTGSDTLYLFPGEMEAAQMHYQFSFADEETLEEELEKQLVSEDPAILGLLTYKHSCFINLHFAGFNRLTASELGYDAFEQPLNPKEKMIFSVTMPDRVGHYRFVLSSYDQRISGLGLWGMNRILVSNSFEIMDE